MSGLIAGAILGGSALAAGGSLGAGFAGRPQDNPGNRVAASLIPGSDFATQLAVYDAARQLGLGDPNILRSARPSLEVFNAVQSLPIDEKSKRRALLGIEQAMNGQQPDYYESTRDVLARAGYSINDLADYAERDRQFNEMIDSIDTDLDRQTFDNRQQATANLAELANLFSSGGFRGSDVFDTIRNQMVAENERDLDNLETRTQLQAQFGGYNPGARLQGIDQERGLLGGRSTLQALEQSLLVAAGAQNLLTPGTQAIQGAAQLSNNERIGALGIAAQQANAANSLATQRSIEGATSLANGIGGAAQILGNTVGNLGVLYGTGAFDTGSTAPGTGGSNYQNLQNRIGNIQSGNYNPFLG